jgi:hypothetical protein
MPRSPLTESIQKVRRLVLEIQETLTVDEFKLLLDELVPEPEPAPTKKPQKKTGKRANGKSQRASGMAAVLNRGSRARRETVRDSDDEDRCGFKFTADGVPCGQPADANVHHLRSELSYHPFVSAFDAQPAAPTSPPPAPARDDSYGVNSGIGGEDAQGAAGGSSGD